MPLKEAAMRVQGWKPRPTQDCWCNYTILNQNMNTQPLLLPLPLQPLFQPQTQECQFHRHLPALELPQKGHHLIHHIIRGGEWLINCQLVRLGIIMQSFSQLCQVIFQKNLWDFFFNFIFILLGEFGFFQYCFYLECSRKGGYSWTFFMVSRLWKS